MTTRILTGLALAATILPVAAAHAEQKPTLVVMHRNIQNTQDEQNWMQLARGLSSEGFRVVSIAFHQDETAQASRAELAQVLDQEDHATPVVLVGTASVSDTVTSVAQLEPTRIKAVVYVSASDAVPSFGPRNVALPAGLALPAYQIKVTQGGYMSPRNEAGATSFKVREEGHSTLGRTDDMIAAILTVNKLSRKA